MEQAWSYSRTKVIWYRDHQFFYLVNLTYSSFKIQWTHLRAKCHPLSGYLTPKPSVGDTSRVYLRLQMKFLPTVVICLKEELHYLGSSNTQPSLLNIVMLPFIFIDAYFSLILKFWIFKKMVFSSYCLLSR